MSLSVLGEKFRRLKSVDSRFLEFYLWNKLLHPVHLFVALFLGASLRIWARFTQRPVRVIGIPTYSFAPLVAYSPLETGQGAEDWTSQTGGGVTVAFLHGPTVKSQPFVLNQLLSRAHESVYFINNWFLRLLYSRYRPGHMEDPLFMSWSKSSWPRWSAPQTVRIWPTREGIESSFRVARSTFKFDETSENCFEILTQHGFDRSVHRGIIAFNIRDSAYRRGQQGLQQTRNGASPRDSDIFLFEKAISHAIQRGYFCVRMGKLVEFELPLEGNSWWDYAYSEYHSEKLDLWIGQNCELAISTASGWDTVPRMYGRPVAMINLGEEFFWSSSLDNGVEACIIAMPKVVTDKEDGSIVPMIKITEHAFGDHRIWKDLTAWDPQNYEIHSLDSTEIREGVELAIDCVEDPKMANMYRNSQRADLEEFWKHYVLPHGLEMPKVFPIIPEPFFTKNRGWLLN